jgi:hypothetical protein
MLETYARHVARTTPHPTDPTLAVTGVKIYRVIHRILGADEFSRGLHPLDPTTYLAYYQGDFEPDGTLKATCLFDEWTPTGYVVHHQDPYLYWIIPIVREQPPEPSAPEPRAFRTLLGKESSRPVTIQELRVRNYVKFHAGDKDEGGDEW